MWFIIMIRQVMHGFCWGQADRSFTNILQNAETYSDRGNLA